MVNSDSSPQSSLGTAIQFHERDPLIARHALEKLTQHMVEAGSTMNDDDFLIPILNVSNFVSQLQMTCTDICDDEAAALVYWVDRFGIKLPPEEFDRSPRDKLIAYAGVTVPGFWMDLPSWLDIGCCTSLSEYLHSDHYMINMLKIDTYNEDTTDDSLWNSFDGFARTLMRVSIHQELTRHSMNRLGITSTDPSLPNLPEMQPSDFENFGRVVRLAKCLELTLDDLVTVTSGGGDEPYPKYFFSEVIDDLYTRRTMQFDRRMSKMLSWKKELPDGWELYNSDDAVSFPSYPIRELKDLHRLLKHSLRALQNDNATSLAPDLVAEAANRLMRNSKRALFEFGFDQEVTALGINCTRLDETSTSVELEGRFMSLLTWMATKVPDTESAVKEKKDEIPPPAIRIEDDRIFVFGKLKKVKQVLREAVEKMLRSYPTTLTCDEVGGSNSTARLREAAVRDEDWSLALRLPHGVRGAGYGIAPLKHDADSVATVK